jgi:putative oxidoreductase
MNDERSMASGMIGTVCAVIDWLSWLAHFIAPLILRIALAVPFYRSGLTKWDGFLSLSPGAVFLFQDEFKLHILGGVYNFPEPATAALLSATAEITLPILLMIGFATRFAAVGLLVMAGIIQLVFPADWANFHLPWAAMALAIIALGPGPISLDHFVDTVVKRR